MGLLRRYARKSPDEVAKGCPELLNTPIVGDFLSSFVARKSVHNSYYGSQAPVTPLALRDARPAAEHRVSDRRNLHKLRLYFVNADASFD